MGSQEALTHTGGQTVGQGHDAAGVTTTPGLLATFLKIGKADAIVLQTPGSVVMVDTGEASTVEKVVGKLRKMGVTRIDHLIITHYDQDHVGGAAGVLDAFPVQSVHTTYGSKTSPEVKAYEAAMMRAGLVAEEVHGAVTFTLDGVRYDLLGPASASYPANISNNSSLVTRVTYGERSLLLAADIQRERIDELLASGCDLSCDVLKMPHHGAWEDNLPALLAACAPLATVITSSKLQRESDAAVASIRAVGAEALLTRKGAVRVSTDGSSLVVEQRRARRDLTPLGSAA